MPCTSPSLTFCTNPFLLDFFVDVQDNARLHVAALTQPDIREKRIFAYAAPYTWRAVQRVLQDLYPGRTFGADIPDAELDGSDIVLAGAAEGWLKDFGQPGWMSLEECIKLNTEDLV